LISEIPHIGEAFALLAPILWGIAVILFKKSGEKVRPVALNLFKNTLAFVLIIPTMPLVGETIIRQVPTNDYFLLIASGILGIGLSDTLFFKSLNLLGASRSAIIGCSYSPLVITLAVIFLGEQFTAFQVIGLALITSAVIYTASDKSHHDIPRKDLIYGVLLGVLGHLGTAISITMIKPLLTESPLLWVTEVRLIGGIATMIVVLIFNRDRKEVIKTLVKAGSKTYTITGSLIGTYMAMVVWLAGMKFTQASTASALNQTNQIFVFIFAAIFLKEKITPRKTIAIILAIAGILAVTLGR